MWVGDFRLRFSEGWVEGLFRAGLDGLDSSGCLHSHAKEPHRKQAPYILPHMLLFSTGLNPKPNPKPNLIN